MEQPLQSFAGNGNSHAHTRYMIEDRSYLSLIKKDIAKTAEALSFSQERIGRLNIILSELVSNLTKYGERKRELLWKPFAFKGEAGIEIISIDGGPGISNTGLALQDGYSTSGTAGQGLGAIKRLSDTFELHSHQQEGTIVLCRLYSHELPLWFDKTFTIGAISVAKKGEQLCGDGYYLACEPEEQLFRVLLLDGIGHGPEAHKAAQMGIAAYAESSLKDQSEILKQMHQTLKKSRGAVGLALEFSYEQQLLRYCGVGNISGRIFGLDGVKGLSSTNGIIGHVISSRIHDQEIPWGKGKLLVLHSDGLTSRWDFSKNLQVLRYDPSVIAAWLYKNFNRGNDDITIVVSKQPA